MTSHPLHDPKNPATAWALNPWHPMTRPIDLKHLGKLNEELNEAGAAVSRCIIQGIAESEPVTHKPNKAWLEDELADVLANIELVTKHFGLDRDRMNDRAGRKMKHLEGWHSMLDGAEPDLRAFRNEVIEECAAEAERQNRVGHEWVRDCIWDRIIRRVPAALRLLKRAEAGS